MPLTAAELEPLLRLALVRGVGPHRLARLIHRFGSAERVFGARGSEISSLPGIGAELSDRIRGATSRAALGETRAALRRLGSLGASAMLPEDPLYPQGFRDLLDPPYLLFTIGDAAVMRTPAIAVVGTRTPTSYGRHAARDLSGELALAGYAIVSGMARGVDTAAHLGALEAGGTTIGILGHGIEQVYPPENRELFREVSERGLLVTEYPPGETPKAGNFPRRNRLITALVEAVLVVEMGHRSGAQHTVTYALEQGKEVMAVPGPIGAPASLGTNQLIRDGAPLVTSAIDVLEELRGVGAGLVRPSDRPGGGRRDANRPAVPALPLMTESGSRLLAVLSSHSAHIDEIAASAALTTREALATLLELELLGLAVSLPGKRFTRA
jgi:DNA processing protein